MSAATTTIPARALLAGESGGRLLVLRAPLNLWSGLDPAAGVIVDAGHPQRGASVTGTILVIPALSGATGGASLAETLRRGTGPAGVVVTTADPSLIMAVAVARELYQVRCPIVQVAAGDLPALAAAVRATITSSGDIELALSGTPSVADTVPTSRPAVTG